jgi:hypothetical protein
VLNMVGEVLKVQQDDSAAADNKGDQQQAAAGGQDQGQQQQAAQQDAQPAQPPPTIQMGQTEDEVVGMIGQPEKKIVLGSKEIFVYKDIKVTFIGGKVADVQ